MRALEPRSAAGWSQAPWPGLAGGLQGSQLTLGWGDTEGWEHWVWGLQARDWPLRYSPHGAQGGALWDPRVVAHGSPEAGPPGSPAVSSCSLESWPSAAGRGLGQAWGWR